MTWLLFTMLPLLLAAAYCVARAIVDFRQGRRWWAIAGLLSAVAIVTVPIPTHAVKVDLPVSDAH